MKKKLDANIDGAAGFAVAPTFVATLRPVAIATGLRTTVGIFGRVNSPLRNRGRRLGLYSGHGPSHNILCGLVGQDGNGYGRNLHVNLTTCFPSLLLTQSNERTLKHLVADLGLEKASTSNLLGKALSWTAAQ